MHLKTEGFALQPRAIEEIRTLDEALDALAAPIDSFLEMHLLQAHWFEITDVTTAQPIGHIAIYNDSLLTHFYLQPAIRRHAQALYRDVRQRFSITGALVPTCDEFFLSHALDEYNELHNQAYFFVSAAPNGAWQDVPALSFQPASINDCERLAELNGDFLDRLDDRIQNGEIYFGNLNGEVVTIGIIERGQLLPDCGSIGMLVSPAHRQKGFGTRMLRYLRHVCVETGLRAVAGCGYSNLLSKRTLEAAGMVSSTRLLRIDYSEL